MKKKNKIYIGIIIIIILFIIILFIFMNRKENLSDENKEVENANQTIKNENDFVIDAIYNSSKYGEIHYSYDIPKDYDKKKSYPLYITLPGYEGLYFQGVGKNLELEDFAEEAKNINDQMIILAPQLNDWQETSANQTIALIEYYKENYNIEKIYANGYSGGGETMSLVMEKRADLIDAYLQVSSKWDGSYENTVKNEVPIYFVVGKNDEYYGATPTLEAYNTLYNLYEEKGLTKKEIDEILILDIKEHDYFTSRGIENEHGGGGLIAHDQQIMNWLLSR